MSIERPKTPADAPPAARVIFGLLAAGGGAAIGLFSWSAVAAPVFSAFLIGVLLSKVAPARNKPMIVPAAIQAGQACWMLIGAIILSRFDLVLLDIVILSIGAIWIAFRPSWLPVVLLTVYHL